MDALSPLYVGKKGSAAESLMFENHSHEKSLPEPKYGPGPSQDACWCPCFPAIRLREVSPLSPQTLGTSILLFFCVCGAPDSPGRTKWQGTKFWPVCLSPEPKSGPYTLISHNLADPGHGAPQRSPAPPATSQASSCPLPSAAVGPCRVS